MKLERGREVLLGYFAMGLLFLILRFFYHILPNNGPRDNLVQAVNEDVASLYDYVKQVVLSHTKTILAILVIAAALPAVPMMPWKVEVLYIVDSSLATIMSFLLVSVFAPHEDASKKGFPVEIFGFAYSIIFIFYNAGTLVVDVFYTNNFFREDMWMYGYSVTVLTYVVCIANLRGFMERRLSNEEIVLLGMIMLTTLEFITYYGIGFFSSMDSYDPKDYEDSLFGNITNIVNQGIYVASQSQILERSDMEIWGSIILNGTDVLTITAVLGYVMQKFMEK